MTREYYTFVSVSTALGILRWVAAIALVALAIFFLVRQIKTKKSLSFITTFISALILVPMLILTPVQVKIEPGTPEPQPVDPIPQVDPEPEPIPEPEPEPISPVTPSNNTPNTKPSGNQTPSTPDEPDAPVAPDEPDTPEEPEVSAKYTVIHRQQNLENDDYTVVESESKTGVAGKTTTPDTKTYTGFIAPATKTATIAKDGSTEIVYDYNRELVALVLEDTDNTTSSLPTGSYKYGTQVTLTAKDRVGYVFANWSNGKTTKNISIELTEATSIKPIYAPNTYLVSFNKNNSAATGSMSTQTLTYDRAEKLSKNSFALEGYTFDHWNTESNDTGNRYADEESVQNLLTEGEITLYAFWATNTNTAYTVNHYKQNIGGGNNYTLARTEDKTGTTDTMATPDRESYTGFTPPAAQSKKITGDGRMVIDYYYTRNQYTVTFGDNAAQISSDVFVSGQKYYYEQTGTLAAGTKTGYTFTGWSDSATDASRSFTVGSEDATIGANYRANNYTVVFHANYAGSTATATQSFTYDQAETALEENSFSRAGYQFDHWNENASDAGQGYSDKEPVQNLTAEDGGEYHLYAQWTANTYKVIFHKNAGEAVETTAEQSRTYGDALPFILDTNTFSRESYRFLGWATTPTGSAEYADEASIDADLSTGDDVDLYAVWEEKFPIVWQQAGDCVFGGNNGTISGNCGDYNGKKFIDTGIQPFIAENHNKDFDIYFEFEGFENTQSDKNQTTLLSIKEATALNNGAPGVVVRGGSENETIEYKSTTDSDPSGSISYPKAGVQKIRIVRKDGVIYFTVNDKNLLFELDTRGDTYQEFGSSVWFGAGEKIIDNVLSPQRVFTGTMRNMYIRMGEMDDFETYTITFDAAGGALSKKTGVIKRGEAIEKLPVPTRNNYLFDGWFVKNSNPQQDVEDGVIPDGDVTYKASWTKDVSQATFANSDLHIISGETDAIAITNAVEPVLYQSSDTSIATVNENGVVTGVSRGETQIIVTGTRSGKTRTINVTITELMTVTFDAGSGTASAASASVEYGQTLAESDIPTATLETYVFNDWWNGENKLTTETPITSNITYTAHWLKDVSHLVIANGSIETTAGDEPIAIQLSGTEDMESFTFSSDHGSIATVDNSGNVTPIAAGTATITIEGDKSKQKRYVDVTVEGPKYTVNFDKNYSTNDRIVVVYAPMDQAIGGLIPSATRDDYIFDGWFTEKKDGTEITSETVIDGNKTFYAHWHYDTMPIVWSHEGQCEFTAAENGSSGNVSGDECQDYATSITGLGYIDTGIELYTDEFMDKDYEIYFEIDEYDPNGQKASSTGDNKQQTFVNAKDPKNSAGLIIRRAENDIEFNTNIGGGSKEGVNTFKKNYAYGDIKKVRVKRVDGAILINYYNGSQWMENDYVVHNVGPSDTYQFAVTTWFGAYPNKDTSGATSANGQYLPKANRFLTGKLSHMFIKLERDPAYESSDEIVTHYTPSAAAGDYFSNIAAWKDNEDTLLSSLKAHYESNSCEDTAITDVSNHAEFAQYQYNSTTGGNKCDRPTPYDTTLTDDLIVRISSEANKETNGAIASYVNSESGKITNMIPGVTYYWESATDSNKYGYVKATGERRFIALDTTRNVRDLGGLSADGNRTIKYGKILRGEAIKTPADKTGLQKLGITVEYETRDDANGPEQFDTASRRKVGLIHYNIKNDGTNSTGGTDDNYTLARKAAVLAINDIIAGESIYIHCSHGADRTGTLAYLLEGLLGVSKEDRYEDYELTTLAGQSDRTRYYRQKGSTGSATAKFVWNRKFVFMTTDLNGVGLAENSDIYDWFMSGSEDPTADEALITSFRNAVLE